MPETINTISSKVLKYFIQENIKMGELPQEQLKMDYIENGLLDSFAIVGLIVYLEDEFKISFTQEDLQSKEFRTILGLSEIILNKIKLKV